MLSVLWPWRSCPLTGCSEVTELFPACNNSGAIAWWLESNALTSTGKALLIDLISSMQPATICEYPKNTLYLLRCVGQDADLPWPCVGLASRRMVSARGMRNADGLISLKIWA
jgi:hypothetical protein